MQSSMEPLIGPRFVCTLGFLHVDITLCCDDVRQAHNPDTANGTPLPLRILFGDLVSLQVYSWIANVRNATVRRLLHPIMPYHT